MKQGTVSISSMRGLAPASSPRDPRPGHQCLQPPSGQKGLRALGAAVQSWDMITAHPLCTEPTPRVGSKGCPRDRVTRAREHHHLGRSRGDVPGVTLVARLATGPGLPWLSCCSCCRVPAKIWSRASRSEHMRDEMALMDRCRGTRAEQGSRHQNLQAWQSCFPCPS